MEEAKTIPNGTILLAIRRCLGACIHIRCVEVDLIADLGSCVVLLLIPVNSSIFAAASFTLDGVRFSNSSLIIFLTRHFLLTIDIS